MPEKENSEREREGGIDYNLRERERWGKNSIKTRLVWRRSYYKQRKSEESVRAREGKLYQNKATR